MIKLLRYRGKLKGIFFRLGMHKVLPSGPLNFFANISALSKWVSSNKQCEFNDYYTTKFNYSKRISLYEYVIRNQHLDAEINYLEFGVSRGHSFKWWITHITNENARFYGFDTFSGLPEDWGPFKKGDMNNENNPPQINDNRHYFYQGLFQQTLIPFLKQFNPEKRKVIHLDADLYSSTLYVLTQLTPYLRSGDIFFFDEFNVPMHEFKAFNEWSQSFYIKYKVLGAVNNFYQVAIILE